MYSRINLATVLFCVLNIVMNNASGEVSQATVRCETLKNGVFAFHLPGADKFKIYGKSQGCMLSTYGEIYPGRVYEFKTSKKDPLIIDCGSNIGFSILYFKGEYPDATVLAFEPDPASFEMLEHNIKINKLQEVHAFNVALGDKDGEAVLSYDLRQEGNPGSTLVGNTNGRGTVSVKVAKLSDYIKKMDVIGDKRIDLLKVDVEGYEHQIFKDLMDNNLLHRVDEMFIEYHHYIDSVENKLADFLKILETNGFSYQFGMWNNNAYLLKGASQGFMLHVFRKK